MSSSALALFPARIPIGYYIDARGQRQPMVASPEFYRALQSLLDRVGGSASDATLSGTLADIMQPMSGGGDGGGDMIMQVAGVSCLTETTFQR